MASLWIFLKRKVTWIMSAVISTLYSHLQKYYYLYIFIDWNIQKTVFYFVYPPVSLHRLLNICIFIISIGVKLLIILLFSVINILYIAKYQLYSLQTIHYSRCKWIWMNTFFWEVLFIPAGGRSVTFGSFNSEISEP